MPEIDVEEAIVDPGGNEAHRGSPSLVSPADKAPVGILAGMERMVPTADGALLWTASEGVGPGIVLSSGGPGCCDYLQPVSALIDDLGTVVRWEQRGCGRSTADRKYDLRTAIEDLETIRAAYGFERWIVGGHSWGANLALAYALEHTERTAGVLYIVGNGAQNDREWHSAYEAARVDRPELLPQFEFPHNLEVNKAGNRSWREYIKHPTFLRRVSDLQVPILFVCASDDIRLSWPVEQLAHLAPKGQFHSVEGAGHHLELTHVGELAAILRRFLFSLER